MPPAPFPEFPTYQKYIDWLADEGIQVEFGDNEWGRFMFAIGPDGSSYIREPAINLDEYIVPSTVERMDFRLGIVSPWNPRSSIQLEAADD